MYLLFDHISKNKDCQNAKKVILFHLGNIISDDCLVIIIDLLLFHISFRLSISWILLLYGKRIGLQVIVQNMLLYFFELVYLAYLDFTS